MSSVYASQRGPVSVINYPFNPQAVREVPGSLITSLPNKEDIVFLAINLQMNMSPETSFSYL